MKKLLLLFVILGSFSLGALAQTKVPEPNVKKFFPKLSWKDYICQKAIVLYLDNNDYEVPANLDYLLDSDEEDDSVFCAQMVKYLEVEENCVIVVGWIEKYYKTIPALQNQITRDDLITAVKDGFGDYLTPAILANLEKQKIRTE